MCTSTNFLCLYIRSAGFSLHATFYRASLNTNSCHCQLKNHTHCGYIPGATQVWFGYGRSAETWKVDPFLYQILQKNDNHFYTRATNFKQNLLEMSHYFLKLLSFQANLGNFGIRLMKLDLFSHQFKKILKIRPMFIPVFAQNKESSLYQ